MKKLLAVLLVGLSLNAWADEVSQRKAIDELLVQTKAENLISNLRAQLQQQNQDMLASFLQQNQANMPLNAAQQAAVDHYTASLSKLMDEMLAWENYKPVIEKVYQETFTEDEIVELITFYKTPLGQKMVDKMPSVVDASMRNMRGVVEKMVPKAQQIGQNFAEEFAQASDVKHGAEDKSGKPAKKPVAKKPGKHAAE